MQALDGQVGLSRITAAIPQYRAVYCLLLASHACPAVARAVHDDAELLSLLALCSYALLDLSFDLPEVRY